MTFDKDYTDTKAFLIARVSDPSQREALPAQIIRLNDYAQKLNLDSELFSFDETAYKDDRKKFQEIVDKIAHYRGKRIAVFDKIDRFTRDSSSEVVRILKDKVREGNLELHFPSDGLIFHKNSPACDKTRLGMGMVFGEYYSAAISDNVKRRIEQKLHDGEFPGFAPIGYRNAEINGKNEIIIDTMRKPLINRAFEMRRAGVSTRNITNEMRRLGLTSNTKNPKPVAHSTICNLFKNKFYYGVMTYRDKDYPHKYQTYITKSIYDEIQRISENNCTQKIQKKTQYEFTFKGILKCAICGCSMSSYTHKGRVYLRCSNAKGKCPNNATETGILSQIEPILDGFTIDENLARAICDELNKDAIRAKELREAQKIALRAEYQKLNARKSIMYEDKLDGCITATQYDELVTKDAKRLCEIDDELVQLEQDTGAAEITTSHLLDLASRASELFKSSKPAVKNQILRLLVSNLKIQQKRLQFNLLEPFAMLSNFNDCTTWLPGPGSNRQPRS